MKLTEEQRVAMWMMREAMISFVSEVQTGKSGAPSLELLQFCGKVHSLLENFPEMELIND